MIHQKRLTKSGIVGIPVAIRRELGLYGKDVLDVEITDDKQGIILKVHNPRCIFCGSSDNTKIYFKKHICSKCIDSIKSFDSN